MFEFRTTFLNVLVWLVAVSQLILQPAASLLHTGCEGRAHAFKVAEKPLAQPYDFWHAVASAWYWVKHPSCCQHPQRSVSVSQATAAASERQRHRTPCSCCSRTAHPAETQDSGSGDSPVPEHDSHQCPICQVVFAARVNTVIVQMPVQTGSVPLTVCEAVRAADIVLGFQLPSRGPPAV